MYTYIYFVRHGMTQWNQEGRIQGHQDIPLHQDGEKQAKLLRDYLYNQQHPCSLIYSSDLSRASKTAQLIGEKLGLDVVQSTHFRERCMGEWEGKKIADIQLAYPDWEKIRDRGGSFDIEKTEDIQSRMLSYLETISTEHEGKHILVVSHGMAINSVLTKLTNGNEGIGKTKLTNTSITTLVRRGETDWKVQSINQTPHIEI